MNTSGASIRFPPIFSTCSVILREADFDISAKPTANGKTAKRGSVLYRVPQDALQKPTRCTIRVAVDEDAILENILLDEHVEIKSRVEISDVMSAELIDPEGSTFRINPLNTRTQLVRDTGYTEWIFNVTPLVEGVHQLLVKVSIMEIVPGFPDPIPREVSVMETVTIVTEGAATDDTAPAEFKPSGQSFAFQSSSTVAGKYEISYSKEAKSVPMEAVPSKSRARTSRAGCFPCFYRAGACGHLGVCAVTFSVWVYTRDPG